MRKAVFKKGSLTRDLMELWLGRIEDQKPFPRETFAEARRLGIPVPKLDAVEGLFR